MSKPIVKKGDEVMFRDRHVGNLGRLVSSDDELVYVKAVRRFEREGYGYLHYFAKCGGYAITTGIVEHIRHLGVERVYVWEYDTGNVLEYDIEDYLNDPVKVKEEGHEPQVCVPEEKATHYENWGMCLWEHNEFRRERRPG